jgi:hypothetical protein
MFELIICDRDGRPSKRIEPLPEQIVQACKQSAELYERIGYLLPWVSYVATVDGTPWVEVHLLARHTMVPSKWPILRSRNTLAAAMRRKLRESWLQSPGGLSRTLFLRPLP